MQIYNFDDFVNEVFEQTHNVSYDDYEAVNEAFLFKRRTGNLVSKMLGGTEKTGAAVFKTINKNVDAIEKTIDEWNKKHNQRIGRKNILELKIDRAKLDIKHLIVLTTLTSAGFISDVIIGNILNYKVLIRPIRNARIITLAYKYYLAMVRHTLQTSLIILNLASDLFFAQLSANLSGHKKTMRDFAANLRAQITRETIDMLGGETMTDEKGNKFSLKSMLGDDQMKRIASWMKTYKTTMDHQVSWDSKMGYNQNIYQETGRNLEQLIKGNQDKELQAISEQFNTIGQVAKAEAKEMIANYAQTVKHSAECRAMEVCARINMNMLDILEMFSIRNIDGYTEAFEEMSEFEKKEDNYADDINSLKRTIKNQQDDYEREVERMKAEYESKLTDKEKETILQRWQEKGIKELCPAEGKNSFRNIAYGNADVTQILKDNGFSDVQISNIVMGTDKVSNYRRIYMDVAKMYAKQNPKNKFHISPTSITIEPDDESKIYKWVRIDSVEDKTLMKFMNDMDLNDKKNNKSNRTHHHRKDENKDDIKDDNK